MVRRILSVFSVPLLLFCLSSMARAEIGVSEKEVVVGTVGSVKVGDREGYTAWISAGTGAYFKALNAAGGIHGRTIKYIVEDDGYEPENTIRLAKKLAEQDKVFTLIGGNGTPNVKSILPFLNKTGIPLLFPFTGGEFLYDPVIENIFTIHLSASQEAKQLVDFAISTLKKNSIGVFSQEDALGTAGRSGVAKALSAYDITIKADGTYKRNTTEIEAAAAAIMKVKPDVVYLASTLHATAEFLKKCVANNYKPIFLMQSSVGPVDDLEAKIGYLDVEIYTVEILPSLKDTSIPLISKFKSDMKSAGHDRLLDSAFALEGYAGAAIFAEALEKMGPANVTRARMREVFEEMKDENIKGMKVSFSPKNHQGLGSVSVYKTLGKVTTKVKYVALR